MNQAVDNARFLERSLFASHQDGAWKPNVFNQPDSFRIDHVYILTGFFASTLYVQCYFSKDEYA
ncbi:hypothetical protein [Bacillus sp. PK3_68]|uniref:hypothetical protein n=1 Tax=Bacillus sp. PK3_68 TaxID=2027408 RepID=UPI0016029F29|nr:hypothetical protein [Bacillus sp. PK3_68]